MRVSELIPLALREFHQSLGARFIKVSGVEVVADYGNNLTEHAALCGSVGVLDLSFRGRLCLVGADRARFLHGQVTNDVKKLCPGQGCYAALTTSKGKMQSDLNIFVLENELLLDFEPGLTHTISTRLEKYIVADDVQVVDASPHYGLFSVQGPRAGKAVISLGLFNTLPAAGFDSVKITDAASGEIYLMNNPRLGSTGFDLFVPRAALGAIADKLVTAAKSAGGLACGWRAFEQARIEAGIPRFGADMDENNIPIECGIEDRAISYSKGCYIGQEVLNRIHSIGHVNRELRRLKITGNPKYLPEAGSKLFLNGKEVGHVTSMTLEGIGLGCVHREANVVGAELELPLSTGGQSKVKITGPPFTAH